MSSIAFLGAGNIAQAIMGGLVDSEHHLWTYDPIQDCRDKAAAMGVKVADSNLDATKKSDVVILCVKPNVIAGLVAELTEALADKLIISVAAGITCGSLHKILGDKVAIVRCMPNTPALVRLGMTAMFATSNATSEQKATAESLLAGVGETLWVEEEATLDAVTAVSGSGPAYFFLMMESMLDAAIQEGLDEASARKLVLQTALGAATMAMNNPAPPGKLREQVTSPGGTTQAALEVFANRGMQEMVAEAIRAARLRSIELSNSR